MSRRLSIVVSVLSLLIFSCEKENESPNSTNTLSQPEILVSKTWTLTSHKRDEVYFSDSNGDPVVNPNADCAEEQMDGWYELIPGCWQNTLMIDFLSNNTFTVTNDGDMYSGTWTMVIGSPLILTIEAGGNQAESSILDLTPDVLKIEFEDHMSGGIWDSEEFYYLVHERYE